MFKQKMQAECLLVVRTQEIHGATKGIHTFIRTAQCRMLTSFGKITACGSKQIYDTKEGKMRAKHMYNACGEVDAV